MNLEKKENEYSIPDLKGYVKIHYSVRIVDGPVLKGVPEKEFMDFVTGYGHVIPGLERRLIGHVSGEKLTFVVPPEEGFGVRHQELVIEKSKEDFHFPNGLEPYPGMEIPIIATAEAAPDTVMIREIRDDSIVIDLNHPLAGLSLRYELEIVEARPAKSSDVCAEWDEKAPQEDGSCSPCEIVIGK